jgi:hypothetical protein
LKWFLITSCILVCTLSGIAQQDERQMTLEMYVQLMTDCGYNFDQINPDYYDVVRPSQLPSYKDEFGPDGNLWFSVRQSYFGLKSHIPSRLGDIKTIFEFDLFGLGPNVGQTTFHLTKAWVEIGPFAAGRFWSPFIDRGIYPNLIEYWGPSGMALCPNLQLRWTPLMGKNRLTVALERPGASVDEGIYRDRVEIQDVKLRFPVPDLSADFRRTGKYGYIELAGILRYIEWKDTKPDSLNLSGYAIGWGLNLSSCLSLSKRLTGKFQVVYGEAIENYMNDGPVDVAIEKDLSDPLSVPCGIALPVLGISAFLDIQWSERLSSCIGYSISGVFNSNGQDSSAFRYGHYALANLLYYPFENFMAGIEAQYGMRQNYLDGWNTSLWKLQFSFRYNFSYVFRKEEK